MRGRGVNKMDLIEDVSIPTADIRLNELKVPDGFHEILNSLSREVMRDQPADIHAYAFAFFETELRKLGRRSIYSRPARFTTRSAGSKSAGCTGSETYSEPLDEVDEIEVVSDVSIGDTASANMAAVARGNDTPDADKVKDKHDACDIGVENETQQDS